MKDSSTASRPGTRGPSAGVTLLAVCAVLWGGAARAAQPGTGGNGVFRFTGERVPLAVDEPGMEGRRTLEADFGALRAALAAAPLEASRKDGVLFEIPMPDGTFQRFRIVEAPTMEPALQARFPEIRSYSGQGIDDRAATVRLDISPFGFHAQVLGSTGRVFVDPVTWGDTERYVTFDTATVKTARRQRFSCGTEAPAGGSTPAPPRFARPAAPQAVVQLRTYRLAVATTGEYTAFFGGTVAGALAAVNTTVNRITGIYEKELAVRLTLVANNNVLIFTNPGSDPFDNTASSGQLTITQTQIDNLIGNANYDVGHLLCTAGGGGLAGLGVVCVDGDKGGGATGSGVPQGDPFDVDFVAHELGHQFGANHSYNGSTDGCSTRNAPTAWEPGSGVTIMGYAGLCGAEDVAANSIPHFHAGTLDEINAYLATTSCAVTAATLNNTPTAGGAPSSTIPRSTPFTLVGSGSDPDPGNVLSYSWEEHDLGPAGPPNTDADGQLRPLFRSFVPDSSPSRTFPKLADILSNSAVLGESLPTQTRTMSFRMTVRDNVAGGGGVTISPATQIQVVSSAGPFVVTAPNLPGVTWNPGNQTVTWNVANTNLAPVSCANVNILFSPDGGLTFPTILAGTTANDGSQVVAAPAAATTQGRVKVACASGIFFDINDANFTNVGGGGPAPTVSSTSPSCANVTGGRSILVNGTGFQMGATVSLLGTACTVTNFSTTQLTCTTGARAAASATLGNVVVTNPDLQAGTLTNGFTYAVRGDANNNGSITPADSIYLNLAIFLGGNPVSNLCQGDVNSNNAITPADSIFLNLFVFLGGSTPGP